MKYFLSGASGIRAHLVPEVAAFIEDRLLSMHKAFKGNTKVWCEVSHHPKSGMKEVMLDSGAFTAFTKGHKVTSVHLRWLNPLNPRLAAYLKGFKRVLVPEMNNGQLVRILRAEYLVDAEGLNKIQGKPFKVAELCQAIAERCPGGQK